MKQSPSRVAVAVSGRGRSLKALIDSQAQHHYEIVGVISSRSQCGAIDYSREMGLPLFVADFTQNSDPDFRRSLEIWLETQKVSWIALAGFLKPFPCLSSYNRRTINIHPALLPRHGGKGMYGIHVHRAVSAAAENRTGATIHFVSEGYDEGAIIAQIELAISPGEAPEVIADQVFAAECRLYPDVLNKLVTGSLPLAKNEIYLIQELSNESR